MADLPETATFAEFARIYRVRPSYVTQLRKAGRLVLEGRRVRVRETLALLESTRDPSHDGVADRHAQRRGEPTATLAPQGAGETAAADDPDDADEPIPATGEGVKYHSARAKREHFLALAAERDYLTSMGALMDAGAMRATVADITTNLRATLERLPAILAPQLAAETDEGRVSALLTESIEQALSDAARRFDDIAREATP